MPIVTFYSYKGGTGRSMALANVAWILASNGQRVLVVDWDLEAPGLHRYFRPFLTDKELTGPDSQGVIDFVVDFSVKVATPPTADLDEKWYQSYADISKWSKRLLWPSGEIANPGVKGSIDFVPAGQQGQQYGQKVNSFDWANFYEQLNGGAFFDAVRRSMASYDWVLIDSRTGVSDTAGICTLQLPDILVVCFTLNYQSINGALAVASAVKKTRPAITIWPVPTRIDGSEEKLLKGMKGYAMSKFSPLLSRYVDPIPYWYGMEVPYFARYAYSEKLAPFEDQTGITTSTLPSMQQLTDWITGGKVRYLVPLPEKDRREALAEFEALPDSLQLETAAPDYRSTLQKWIDQWMGRTFIAVKKLGFIPVVASVLIGIIASLGSNQFFEWFKPRNTFDVLLSGAQKDIQSGRSGARDHAALLLAEAAKLRQINSGTSPFDASNKADTRLLDLFYSLGPLQSGSTRHNAAVRIVRFNRDGTLVVTASDDKTSRAFRADGSSGPDWSVTNSGWAVDFSPDGKYLACGTDNGVIAIYDAQSLRLLFWTRQQGAVQKVVFSPDSQTLLSAADNVLLVNLVPFRQLATFSKYKDPTSVAFSPDSLYFAESSIEGQVTVLSARPPGKFFQTLENHTGPVRVVTFAPGATSWELATASVDGTAAIWVKGSPYPLASLRVGADVYAAAFSPDGKFLATGSLDGTARLWSAPDGKQVGAVKYLADVRALDFSPDGKWLAIGSGDKTARIIEVATFKELERITYRAEVNSVAFSRDQKYLAVASSDGTAGTWLVLPSGSRLPSMNPAEMISLACKQITSDALLSESEWQQYFGREAYHPACNQQNTTFGGGSGFNGGGSSGKY